MKQNLITDVVQAMLPYLNNAQSEKLQEVLEHTLFDYEVTKNKNDEVISEQNLVESFLSAKKIEGCSEKTLKYYEATIHSMLDGIGKEIKYIVTDDIRCYLTEYQAKKNSSKVTIDNIRRILSSFFSWLEDEDYILKSPVNRNDNAEENECDDKNAGDLFGMQFWKMPLYRDNWIEDFSMKLSSEEAAFLKEQIITSCKGSMLAYVLENDIAEFLDCTSFQDVSSIIDMFPEDIKETYWLAYAFSDFIYTIRTVYNIVISDGKNDEANRELERLQPIFSELADIDIDYILEKLEVFNNPLLRKFLKQCQEYMIAGNVEALKKCITSREVQLKGTNRAKTKHPGEFNPNEWLGGKELDYRFYNARTIVRDIMESEDKTDA